jgi:hypothetical protein
MGPPGRLFLVRLELCKRQGGWELAATFEIDSLDPQERVRIEHLVDLVRWEYVGDLASHDYRIIIIQGQRSHSPCSLQPADAASHPQLGCPPRICHILPMGTHIHQYERALFDRVIRLIDPNLPD